MSEAEEEGKNRRTQRENESGKVFIYRKIKTERNSPSLLQKEWKELKNAKHVAGRAGRRAVNQLRADWGAHCARWYQLQVWRTTRFCGGALTRFHNVLDVLKLTRHYSRTNRASVWKPELLGCGYRPDGFLFSAIAITSFIATGPLDLFLFVASFLLRVWITLRLTQHGTALLHFLCHRLLWSRAAFNVHLCSKTTRRKAGAGTALTLSPCGHCFCFSFISPRLPVLLLLLPLSLIYSPHLTSSSFPCSLSTICLHRNQTLGK